MRTRALVGTCLDISVMTNRAKPFCLSQNGVHHASAQLLRIAFHDSRPMVGIIYE